MKSIYNHLKWLFYNILTIISNMFIKRNNKIWLFGSWMSERFADNSRALYQFLHFNKEIYDIERVVWVTSKKEIYKELNDNGFECYMLNSKKSLYFHLKAGIHVGCNMYDNINDYKGDIYGRFSFGAKKIQLWHGIGVKAVGELRKNSSDREQHICSIKRKLKKYFSYPIFFPGGWNNCYWLVSGIENKKVITDEFAVNNKRIISAIYPRFFTSLFFTEKEKKVIEEITYYKSKGYSIIMYFPTFRKKYDRYVAPEDALHFDDFLLRNKIMWIKKSHLASTYNKEYDNFNNKIILDAEFDINTILKYADLVISDYSSIITDAIFLNIRTINYIPDFDYYKNIDRGFVGDYDVYNPGWKVFNIDSLCFMIEKALYGNYFDFQMKDRYRLSYKLLIDSSNKNLNDLVKEIFIIINGGDIYEF